MKVRSILAGAAVLAGIAFAPRQASATTPDGAPCTYSVGLGLGGAISGCFGFTLNELGENAGYTSRQFYWNGNFGSVSGATNVPSLAGTEFFNDDCGSGGTVWAFCTGTFAKTPVAGSNTTGELVFGLLIPDNLYLPYAVVDGGGNGLAYWQYSGTSSRNAIPAPTGFQEILYQLTLAGNPIPGEFLFAWEDLNSGCTASAGSASNPSTTTFAFENLGNVTALNDPNNCTALNAGGNSDNDFNDSYIRLSITGTRLDIVPEPMTMTLMATGLVGLAGAQIRRRKKNQD